MKNAETITFGGGGLDRAALQRGETGDAAAAMTDPSARMLIFWRGKPLIEKGDICRLHIVPVGHPILDDRQGAPIFLGLVDGEPRFAVDISRWEPDQETGDPKVFFDATEQQHPTTTRDAAFCELRGVMALLGALDGEMAATGKAILGWHRSHRFCAACGQESVATMGGWQRVCPACNTNHFPRTDPVVIMLITSGNSVLVGRSHFWPDGMYSLLAGFLEPGETIEAAVRREVEEETNIRVGEVGYLASQPWPYPSSLMIGCWGKATSRDITVDPNELDDAIWMTREEMLTSFAGDHPTVKPARKGSIAHFLVRNWLADTLD